MARRLIIVGAGGLAFHGIGALALHARAADVESIWVVDPDVQENANGDRQLWGPPTTWKAQRLAEILRYLLPGGVQVQWCGVRVQDLQPTPERGGLLGEHVTEAHMVVLADNWEARRYCWHLIRDVPRDGAPIPFLYATAGNELDPETGGYRGSASGVRVPNGYFGEDAGWVQFEQMHEADWLGEEDEEDEGAHCGDAPLQTAWSNIMTVSVLHHTLAMLRDDWTLAEWRWRANTETNPEGREVATHGARAWLAVGLRHLEEGDVPNEQAEGPEGAETDPERD